MEEALLFDHTGRGAPGALARRRRTRVLQAGRNPAEVSAPKLVEPHVFKGDGGRPPLRHPRPPLVFGGGGHRSWARYSVAIPPAPSSRSMR